MSAAAPPAEPFDLGPWLALGAAADFPTGLALALAPGLPYGVLGIALPAPLFHARLAGAFVGAVGFLYWLAWRRPADRRTLVVALTWIRLAVVLVTGLGVALGAPAGFLVVTLTDGAFAALQLAWLAPGGGLPWR